MDPITIPEATSIPNNPAPATTDAREDALMDQYLDLVEKFGAGSKEAQEFRNANLSVPAFSELVSVMDDLEGSSQRATLLRRLNPLLIVASAVVVGVIGLVATWRGQELAASQWGWNKPGIATANQLAPVYYKSLASAAENWSAQRPEEPIALARRITEFRLGCSRIIHAEKGKLSAEERDWLRGECRKWGETLDHRLEELDTGTPVAQVRDEIDKEVTRIATVLRGRADRLQTSE